MKLEDYERLVKGKVCRWCNSKLPPKVRHFDHENGWKVDGFDCRQWLYVRCKKCGYDWNLEKLGIRRDARAFSPIKKIDIIVAEDRGEDDDLLGLGPDLF
jgi:hypothetical protein